VAGPAAIPETLHRGKAEAQPARERMSAAALRETRSVLGEISRLDGSGPADGGPG